MCGEKIAETVLEMVREVEQGSKEYEEQDTVHYSLHTYLHEHRTVVYKLSRGAGHSTAAKLLQTSLPSSVLISSRSGAKVPLGDHSFSFDDIAEGRAKGIRYDYVIVDNWSHVAPVDRGFIQEFCLSQHYIPVLILLA
jgi:hypothetical protein